MLFGISKTTLQGALSLAVVICIALLSSGSPVIGARATVIITLILGVLKAVVGWLQNDAPANPPPQQPPQ